MKIIGVVYSSMSDFKNLLIRFLEDCARECGFIDEPAIIATLRGMNDTSIQYLISFYGAENVIGLLQSNAAILNISDEFLNCILAHEDGIKYLRNAAVMTEDYTTALFD